MRDAGIFIKITRNTVSILTSRPESIHDILTSGSRYDTPRYSSIHTAP
jgi:hypothetical protein